MNDLYMVTARREIQRWEAQRPGYLTRLGDFALLPAEHAARTLIPARLQDMVARSIYRLLSGLNSATYLVSDEDRIRHQVERKYQTCGDELQAADLVAKSCWRKHVAWATGEGGVTGAVGLPGLAADIPALFAVSLRLIQQTGICHGYDVSTPEEREYLMHVLRIGSTSGLKAKMELLVALKPVEDILIKVSWRKMNEALARREISRLSLLAAARQLAQKLGVQLTKRKALQLVPGVGAVVGASFNAMFVNDVGRAAYMLYRRRHLAELERPELVTPDDSDTVAQAAPRGPFLLPKNA